METTPYESLSKRNKCSLVACVVIPCISMMLINNIIETTQCTTRQNVLFYFACVVFLATAFLLVSIVIIFLTLCDIPRIKRIVVNPIIFVKVLWYTHLITLTAECVLFVLISCNTNMRHIIAYAIYFVCFTDFYYAIKRFYDSHVEMQSRCLV